MMTFGPAIGALAFHFVIFKTPLVRGSIRVDSKSGSIFPIVLPATFILSKNSISVSLTVIDLKSVTMSYFGVRF